MEAPTGVARPSSTSKCCGSAYLPQGRIYGERGANLILQEPTSLRLETEHNLADLPWKQFDSIDEVHLIINLKE